jgi:AhpD family alkylhydroperoxidase
VVAVKYVNIVSPAQAQGPVGEIYKQTRREMGLLPEAVTLFSPAPEINIASWALFRELMIATGRAAKADKEAIAAVVSRQNECPYCVDAHTIMLYGSGGGKFATQLLSGVPAEQLHPSLRRLAEWAERGATEATASGQAPFPADQLPELVGTVVEFHFLNRMLNVVVGQTFLPGRPRAHRIVRPITAMVLRRKIRATNPTGKAAGLDFSASQPLPGDLSWATPNPSVAVALSAMVTATERAAARAASPAARDVIQEAIGSWTGENLPLTSSWLDQAVAAASPGDQPAIRLALLTAVASYRVTEADVIAYRAQRDADEDLIGLLSWSAFSAARRIGAWTAAAAVNAG